MLLAAEPSFQPLLFFNPTVSLEPLGYLKEYEHIVNLHSVGDSLGGRRKEKHRIWLEAGT